MEVLDSFQGAKAPAGMFKRGIAFAIDVAILIVVERIAAKLTGRESSAFMLESIVGAFYYGVLEGVAGNASVGKRVMGLRVCDLNGQDVGFLPAFIRGVVHNLSWVILGIGLLMAFFNERGQALHDRLAGTMVVDVD